MCIFCKIINKEIPAQIIYEDKYCIGMLDINPQSEGHTLIIPKKHYETLTDIDDKTLKHIIIIVKKISNLIKEKLNYSDYNIIMNNGPKADQEINHAHIHIIPRNKKINHHWPAIKVSVDDLKKTKEKIFKAV